MRLATGSKNYNPSDHRDIQRISSSWTCYQASGASHLGHEHLQNSRKPSSTQPVAFCFSTAEMACRSQLQHKELGSWHNTHCSPLQAKVLARISLPQYRSCAPINVRIIRSATPFISGMYRTDDCHLIPCDDRKLSNSIDL